MNTEASTFSLAKVKDLLDRWRQAGSLVLASGVELIGQVATDGGQGWLHAVHPGLSVATLAEFEASLGRPLPRDLRAVYRRIGGMTAFRGAFRLFGFRRAGVSADEHAMPPDDLLRLDHELDVLGWKPPKALAFAENGLDLSVHVIGMARDQHTVLRCERATGKVVEQHPDVWTCLADRLGRLDELLADEARPAQE